VFVSGRLAVLVAYSAELNAFRANPFQTLNHFPTNPYFHNFHPIGKYSRTLRVLDHTVQHTKAKYSYPNLSDVVPKHLMREKADLFGAHPLPVRRTLSNILPLCYQRSGLLFHSQFDIANDKEKESAKKKDESEVEEDEDEVGNEEEIFVNAKVDSTAVDENNDGGDAMLLLLLLLMVLIMNMMGSCTRWRESFPLRRSWQWEFLWRN